MPVLGVVRGRTQAHIIITPMTLDGGRESKPDAEGQPVHATTKRHPTLRTRPMQTMPLYEF